MEVGQAADGRPDLFYIDDRANKYLCHLYQDTGGNWNSSCFGDTNVIQLAVMRNTSVYSYTQEVFYRSSNGNLYHRWETSQSSNSFGSAYQL